MVFQFLKGGRSRAPGPDSQLAGATPAPNSVSGHSVPSHTATHRELVRVVLRDTLRLHGMPIDWIGCEMSAHPSRKGSLLIQMVVHHWHPDLMSYAPVLQKQFMLGLQRFDPTSDHGGHLVVWKFAADCGCPHVQMPTSDFWEGSAAKPRFDLPPSGHDIPGGREDFAPTVPSALR